ncbi:MAG: 50S ribosomal protein L29 [Candidatus Omnitrophica bacterium]|nr:50S ribosomal protein L29 [Candidatus Omnitrophota bacterium]
MLKVDDVRAMTLDEIEAKVDASKKESFSLRVQAKTGKLERQHRMRELKKDIARLLTIKREMKTREAKDKEKHKEQ